MAKNADSDELGTLLNHKLVLNSSPGNNGKGYYRQHAEVPDLFPDPIDIMRKQRLKNVGEFIFVGLDDVEEGSDAINLNNILFPAEYEHLLSLNELTEDTLRPNKYLWRRLMNKAIHTKDVVEKETLLICLNWAQSKLDEKEPIVEYALLNYSSHTIEKSQFGGKMATVALELRITDKKGNLVDASVRKGSLLKFSSTNTGMPLNISWAKLKYIRDKVITLHVYVYGAKTEKGKAKLEYLFLLDNEEVSVFQSQPDFIPQSMLRSIERIKSGILDDIITPQGFPTLDNGVFGPVFKSLLPTLKAYTGLNKRQAQVLYSICTSTHSKFPFILLGPPGTGKTRVIASTVRCLLEMDPGIRILLTAPSNMAADMIARKLMEQFDSNTMNSSNVLRLRSIGNDYFGRDKSLDPISCFDSAAEIFKIPDTGDFKKYRVIISTLGCSTHIINRNIPPGFFSHIFLDEAGQAGESEIWIPLGGLATTDTSVVLCGDPKQLGPVGTLNLPPYVTKRFDSALVRYMNTQCYKFDERLFCLLRRSFRCHAVILSIVSSLFYNGDLKSGILYRDEIFNKWTGLPKKDFPILFVNVNGKQFMDKNSNSYANNHEIFVILAYIRQILKEYEMDPSQIGVISPYRHQTQLLTAQLEKSDILGGRRITVDSVERFQGSERKVILITTTRTSGLGFVGCDLRLNTSISRAMNLLVVVGNKEALYGHLKWGKFLDYCEQNNSLIEWDKKVQAF